MGPACDYNHVCTQLQDYMLTDNTIMRALSKLQKNVNTKPQKPAENKKVQNNYGFFIPEGQDKLFWCFYIIQNGFEDYELGKNSLFTMEKEFKIASIEKIRLQKDVLKEHKLRRNEIEDELLNQKKITLKGLHALCLIYKLNILYAWDNKYWEIQNNEEDKTHIITQLNQQDMLMDNLSEEKHNYYLNNYRNNYWKIENLAKPLKAFSFYSASELQDICKRLIISLETKEGKKKTKRQMYDEILQKL